MNSQSIECECGCWNIVLKVVPPGDTCPCGNPQPHDVCPKPDAARDECKNTSCKDRGKGYNIFQFERCKDCGELHLGQGVCPIVGAKPMQRFTCVAHSNVSVKQPGVCPPIQCVPQRGAGKQGACAPAGVGGLACFPEPPRRPPSVCDCDGPNVFPRHPCPAPVRHVEPEPCPPMPTCPACPGAEYQPGFSCPCRNAVPDDGQCASCGRDLDDFIPGPQFFAAAPPPACQRIPSRTCQRTPPPMCQRTLSRKHAVDFCSCGSGGDRGCGGHGMRHAEACDYGSAGDRGCGRHSMKYERTCDCGGSRGIRSAQGCHMRREPSRTTYCAMHR